MKKLLVLLIMIYGLIATGQDLAEVAQVPVDLYFDQEQFGDSFAIVADNDNVYHYCVTDLTKFSSWVEKTAFLNLVYKGNTIICIDSDISKDQLWFKVPQNVPEDDATCLLDEYRQQARDKVSAMTADEVEAWKLKNKKFTRKND